MYIYIYLFIYIYTIHVSTTRIRFSDPSGSQYRDLMEKNSRVCRRFFHLYVYPSFFPGHPRRMEISEEKNPRDPKKKPTKSEQCRFLKHLLYQSQNKKTKKKNEHHRKNH